MPRGPYIRKWAHGHDVSSTHHCPTELASCAVERQTCPIFMMPPVTPHCHCFSDWAFAVLPLQVAHTRQTMCVCVLCGVSCLLSEPTRERCRPLFLLNSSAPSSTPEAGRDMPAGTKKKAPTCCRNRSPRPKEVGHCTTFVTLFMAFCFLGDFAQLASQHCSEPCSRTMGDTQVRVSIRDTVH